MCFSWLIRASWAQGIIFFWSVQTERRLFVLVVFIMLFQIRPTFGVCLIAVWLLWRLNSILHHGSVIKRPNIRFIELPTRLGQALSSFLYLISGPKMLLRAYQGSGSPIALRTPEGYYIHISSTAHINELLGAPEGTFSLHALSKLVCSLMCTICHDCLPKGSDAAATTHDEWPGTQR